jgi:DNA ligase (NAD+)
VAKAASVAKEIEKLREDVRRHEELYYVHDSPEISDVEYDQLLERLKKLEDQHPEYVTPDSPTQRVGGRPAEGFAKVVHRRPMLSLDNSYNIEELRAFDQRCRRLADGRAFEYVAELKIDGLSMSLLYEKGILIRGLTRGDGQTGEDVTQNARTIRTVPLRIRSQAKSLGDDLEVRGEVFYPRQVFERINAEREEQDEPRFANARNAASGTIRQLDSRIVATRRLDMFAYDLLTIDRKPFPSH